jgi:broad specificity phosphatase PhoE
VLEKPVMSVHIVYETHATSLDNERGIATGWLGGELSQVGREQARALGRRRRHDGVDVVFASDLNRAVETAQIAFAGAGLPVRLDWRLRECNYGSMNGMPRSRLDTERRLRLDAPFPEGESWREAITRVRGFIDELPEKHEGQRVVVIGHVATRWALDCFLDGRRLEDLVDAPFEWREGWEYTTPGRHAGHVFATSPTPCGSSDGRRAT